MHDGARPLVTCEDITRTVEALAADTRPGGSCAGVSPASDTVKLVDEDGAVVATPDRRTVLARSDSADLPLGFASWTPTRMRPRRTSCGSTDDAYLVEARGGRVVMVKGSPENFKVTDRVDLRHAEQILAERRRD